MVPRQGTLISAVTPNRNGITPQGFDGLNAEKKLLDPIVSGVDKRDSDQRERTSAHRNGTDESACKTMVDRASISRLDRRRLGACD